MRRHVLSFLGLACFGGTALAINHDTFTFTSQVSNGTNGSALNQVSTASTNNAYSVARVRVNGTLVSGGVNSYESEARILVTPPNGSPFTIQPFSLPAAFGTVTTPQGGYVFDLPPGFPNSHGTWTFRFFESFDDPGIDATWQTIGFTMDDGTTQENMEVHPTAGTAIAGVHGALISMYLVPGLSPYSTNMAVTCDLSAVGGSAAQTMYDDGPGGGHGDLVAGDHFYSFTCSPTTAVWPGTYTINYHATDAQGRNVYGNFPLEVQGMTNMGSLLVNGTTPAYYNLAQHEVRWFKITVPYVGGSDGWLDIWSNGPAGGDTEIGLYDSTGQLLGTDDDSDSGYLSALSFGQGTPTRAGHAPDGIAFDGRNGALPAGTYYLAYGMYPVTFADNWTVSSTGPAGTGGGVSFQLAQRTDPTVTGNIQTGAAQDTVLIRAYPQPGADPMSQNMIVFADFWAFGQPVLQMYDNGTHGDWDAGDGIFSLEFTIPAGTAVGTYPVTLMVQDSLYRQGNGNATVYVDVPGELPATARHIDTADVVQTITGSLSTDDVDMYRIHICDPAHFSAISTTNVDAVLYLFRADGTGVAMTDDTPPPYQYESRLQGPVVTSIPPGDYYLAITTFGKQPYDASGQLLWLNAGYVYATVAPDGPGAANPIASWKHWDDSAFNISYSIALTGVSGHTCPPICTADFNGDGDIGTDADIEAFFACLAGSCCPTCGSADFNGDGDVGTDADIEAFFRVLAGGAC